MQDPTNKSGAFCSVCECKLKDANKTDLMRHKATRKHVNTFKAKQNTLQISSFFNKPAKSNTEEMTARTEVLLAGFMAEHRMPFLQADHLSDRFQGKQKHHM